MTRRLPGLSGGLDLPRPSTLLAIAPSCGVLSRRVSLAAETAEDLGWVRKFGFHIAAVQLFSIQSLISSITSRRGPRVGVGDPISSVRITLIPGNSFSTIFDRLFARTLTVITLIVSDADCVIVVSFHIVFLNRALVTSARLGVG